MRGQNADILNLRRVSEAALLIAAFTGMAFQFIRFEKFETEKSAILGFLALVIVGASIAEYFERRTLPGFKNPVMLAVLAFTAVATVSTLFSIYPTYSFWGSPTRSHGLLMVFTYTVLFWQASRSGQRLREALFPILALSALPMSIWAIIEHYNPPLLLEDGSPIVGFRAPSTAGNPNYMAGWLAMFFLYFFGQVISRVIAWKRPIDPIRIVEGLTYLAILAITGWGFFVLASRGPMVGLSIGLSLGLLVALSAMRRRIMVIGLMILLVVGAAGYFAISQNFQGRSAQFGIRFERVFIPYDESRVVLWETATDIISRHAEPLNDVDGDPDQWAFLRPALGYGMETLEQIQNRFGERFEQSAWGDRFVERFHNLLFDWIVEVGSLGLMTMVLIYQTAWYIGLRQVGLIRQQQIWYWVGLQLLGVPFGVWFVSSVIPQAEWTALIPLGSALGSLLGTTLWVARSAFETLPEDAQPFTLNYTNITTISIICIVTSQWIDNQFGFMQIMSSTLFFLMLGFLVSLTSRPEEVDNIVEENYISVPETKYWYGATLIVGLFVLYAFGMSIASNFIAQSTIGTHEIPYFLSSVFIVGSGGIIFSRLLQNSAEQPNDNTIASRRARKKKRRRASQKLNRVEWITILLSLIVLVWPIFLGVTYLTEDHTPATAAEVPANQPDVESDDIYTFIDRQDITIPALVFVGLLIGTGVVWLMRDESKPGKTSTFHTIQEIVTTLLVILLCWQLFFIFRFILINSAGESLDRAITNPTGPDVAGIQNAYIYFAINGITLLVIGIVTWFMLTRGERSLSFSLVGSGLIAIFLLLGMGFYARNFSISAMRETAGGFAMLNRPEPVIASDIIYERASSNWSSDVKLKLSWSEALMRQAPYFPVEQQSQLIQRVVQLREEAMDVSPYFVNSITWEVGVSTYNNWRQQLETFIANQASGQPPGQPSLGNTLPPGIESQLGSGLPPGLPFAPPISTPPVPPPGSGN